MLVQMEYKGSGMKGTREGAKCFSNFRSHSFGLTRFKLRESRSRVCRCQCFDAFMFTNILVHTDPDILGMLPTLQNAGIINLFRSKWRGAAGRRFRDPRLHQLSTAPQPCSRNSCPT